MNYALIIAVTIMVVCFIILMIAAGNAKTDTELFDYDINELDQEQKGCETAPTGKDLEPGNSKAPTI